jgi:hypothetical protein
MQTGSSRLSRLSINEAGESCSAATDERLFTLSQLDVKLTDLPLCSTRLLQGPSTIDCNSHRFRLSPKGRRHETSLNRKIQDPIETLDEGTGVLELNSLHEECLLKKQPGCVLYDRVIDMSE